MCCNHDDDVADNDGDGDDGDDRHDGDDDQDNIRGSNLWR